MQVYDTANRLAQEIRDSEEFKLYKKRKDEIHNDPEKKQKVEDFEKLDKDSVILLEQKKIKN